MILRDYQQQDIEAIFHEWETVRSTLYVAATGLGKTRVMTEVAHRLLPARTLFLCHRDELISQARDAFLRQGMECEIEKAELVASTNLFTRTPVVLASVQTMLSGSEYWKRMQRFKPEDFGLLLYDESHHCVSEGNRKIVDYFVNGNERLRVLGVTATPDRADEEALGQIFASVAGERDILWGKDNGWLVDIEQLFVPIAGLDWSHIQTTAGDLNSGQLAAVMEQEESVQGIVQPTIETLHRMQPGTLNNKPVAEWLFPGDNIYRRRAIVFTVSVAQAEMLSNIFNRVQPGLASWVCGKTPDRERQLIFADFKQGKTAILVNCGVTTEGYDNPMVDMIVMGRPTKSRSLYAQMAGRSTRTLPGIIDGITNAEQRLAAIANSRKPVATIMDFVGNSGRHKLITTADILGGNVSDEAADRAVRKAKEDGKPVRMSELLDKSEEEIRAEIEERRRSEEARKIRLVARTTYTTRRVDPFNVFDLQPARERGWDTGKKLSPKQLELLAKQGVNGNAMPYAQAKAVINEMFRRWNGKLATLGQCSCLKKFGYETKEMTFKEAHGLLDALKANGWRRPDAPERNEFLEHRQMIAK